MDNADNESLLTKNVKAFFRSSALTSQVSPAKEIAEISTFRLSEMRLGAHLLCLCRVRCFHPKYYYKVDRQLDIHFKVSSRILFLSGNRIST